MSEGRNVHGTFSTLILSFGLRCIVVAAYSVAAYRDDRVSSIHSSHSGILRRQISHDAHASSLQPDEQFEVSANLRNRTAAALVQVNGHISDTKPKLAAGSSQRLRVVVVSATHLRNADTGVFGNVSDPYVKVKLQNEKGRGNKRSSAKKFKTETVSNSLNPTWKKTNTFEFDDYVPGKSVVHFDVMDSDTVSRDDLLGWAEDQPTIGEERTSILLVHDPKQDSKKKENERPKLTVKFQFMDLKFPPETQKEMLTNLIALTEERSQARQHSSPCGPGWSKGADGLVHVPKIGNDGQTGEKSWLSTRSSSGASWRQYLNGFNVFLDSEGRLSGPWAECLAWAIIYDLNHADYKEICGDGGCTSSVLGELELRLAGHSRKEKLMDAVLKFSKVCQQTFGNRQNIPNIMICIDLPADAKQGSTTEVDNPQQPGTVMKVKVPKKHTKGHPLLVPMLLQPDFEEKVRMAGETPPTDSGKPMPLAAGSSPSPREKGSTCKKKAKFVGKTALLGVVTVWITYHDMNDLWYIWTGQKEPHYANPSRLVFTENPWEHPPYSLGDYVFDNVGDWYDNTVAVVSDFAEDAWTQLANIDMEKVGDGANTIVEAVTEGAGPLGDLCANVGVDGIDAISSGYEILKSVDYENAINSLGSMNIEEVTGMASSAFDLAAGHVEGAVDAVANSGMVDHVVNAVSHIGEKIGNSDLLSGLQEDCQARR